MFLKDSWRDSNLPQESEILRLLNDAGVRNVPTLVCGGVLLGQQTTSHTYIKKDWNLGAHPTMICVRLHQRTLTKEVRQPLKRFKSSKQLTRVVYEAFLGVCNNYRRPSSIYLISISGHEDTFTKCGFLHRDVSGGNILIVYDKKTLVVIYDGGGRGLLNDWDMAIPIANLAKARQAERTVSVILHIAFPPFSSYAGHMAIHVYRASSRQNEKT